MSELRDQQQAFVARVFGSDVLAEDGVSDEGRSENKCADVLALKRPVNKHFTDAQRFQIYRNNSVIGLRSALEGVYPVINRLVGDEFFQHAAREYIRQHPARDGNVHEFGDAFPAFLANFPGADALVYLPDVARLEWAYHQVFHASESTLLTMQDLATLDNVASEKLHFRVSSHCRLLFSDYPVLRICQMNQSGQEAPLDDESQRVSLDEGGVQLVVLRQGVDVEFRPMNKVVFSLLLAFSEGKTFVEACAAVLQHDSDIGTDINIGEMLKDLVEQGLLSGFYVSE